MQKSPRMPRPEIGYAIVKTEALPDTMIGAVIVPTPGSIANARGSAALDEEREDYKRITIVATSGGRYVGSNWVEHSAKPGDHVLPRPGGGRGSFDRDPWWPEDHYLIALEDYPVTFPAQDEAEKPATEKAS